MTENTPRPLGNVFSIDGERITVDELGEHVGQIGVRVDGSAPASWRSRRLPWLCGSSGQGAAPDPGAGADPDRLLARSKRRLQLGSVPPRDQLRRRDRRDDHSAGARSAPTWTAASSASF